MFPQRPVKGDGHVAGHDLIPFAMNAKGRDFVPATPELRNRADGVDLPLAGRAMRMLLCDAVEEVVEASALFEKTQDELRARVAGAYPAQIGAIASPAMVVAGNLRLTRCWLETSIGEVKGDKRDSQA